MSLDKELKFDEEGFHYFVNSGHVFEAEGYNFICSAYIHEDDFKDRILCIEFKDGYLADFQDEGIADALDERLREIPGVDDVYWEDQELFNITYKEGQAIPELIKKIDAKVTELSNLVE